MEERRVKLKQGEIVYYLTRKKVKNVNLRIREKDGSIQVSAPYGVSTDFIDGFVASNSDFIFKALEKCRVLENKKKDFSQGDEIYYLGEKYALVTKKADINSVEILKNEVVISMCEPENTGKRAGLLEEWLEGERNRVFYEVFEGIFPVFELLGIKRPVLIFKNSVSRWGYCQMQKGIVMMNKQLICVPLPLIEYLVLHELTHFIYPDHSKSFWDFMTRFMPDCKNRRNLLKKYNFLL